MYDYICTYYIWTTSTHFQIIQSLLELLTTLDTWIDEIPPIEQPQRFGNKAYRDWFNRLKEVSYKAYEK